MRVVHLGTRWIQLATLRVSPTLVVLLVAWGCERTRRAVSLEAWRAEPELTLGSLEGGATAFSWVTDVEVDSTGTMYVLEQGSREIRVFGEDGSFVRRVGGAGQGPGEFQSFWRAGWKSDSLWVEDPMAGRITLFSDELTAVRTVSFQKMVTAAGGPIRLRPAMMLADGTILGGSGVASSARAGGLWDVPIYRLDMDGNVLGSVLTLDERHKMLLWGETGRSTFDEPLSDADLYAVARDGESVWKLRRRSAQSSGGAVMGAERWSLSGTQLLLREIPYPPLPVSPTFLESIIQEEIVQPLQEVGYAPDRMEMLRRAYEARGYHPPFHPPASGLVAGSDGTLWIRREEMRRDSVAWLVLGRDAGPWATVQLPSDIDVMRASAKNVWGVRRGNLGEPYVVRLRVVRGAVAGDSPNP